MITKRLRTGGVLAGVVVFMVLLSGCTVSSAVHTVRVVTTAEACASVQARVGPAEAEAKANIGNVTADRVKYYAATADLIQAYRSAAALTKNTDVKHEVMGVANALDALTVQLKAEQAANTAFKAAETPVNRAALLADVAKVKSDNTVLQTADDDFSTVCHYKL
jgi:hypothetical protein